jgi:hypothetical protein
MVAVSILGSFGRDAKWFLNSACGDYIYSVVYELVTGSEILQ